LHGAVLQVRHDHDPWGSCHGELAITETGIEYKTREEKHSRQWAWIEIQTFDRQSEQKFRILTWEDLKLQLGLDRYFDFTVLPDTAPLSSEAFKIISDHLQRPIVDRIAVEDDSYDYGVPAKHLHAFGGCEGVIHFSKDLIVYRTDHAKHARTWTRKRDIGSVWSLHKYQLEVHVFEENQREFNKTRRYRFQLKQPLNQEYYYRLRREFLSAR
jgi:hypothetical protein